MNGKNNKPSSKKIGWYEIGELIQAIFSLTFIAAFVFSPFFIPKIISHFNYSHCETYKVPAAPHQDLSNSEYWIHKKEYQSEDPNRQIETHDEIIREGVEGEGKRCENKDGEVVSDEITIPAQAPKIKRTTTGFYKEPVRYTSPQYSTITGAICRDGSRSYATGRGACSWHGGVAQWVYE